MSNFYNRYIRTIEVLFTGTGIADGNTDFTLEPFGPKRIVVEYFTFITSAGAKVAATLGDVTITVSPGEDLFQNMDSNGTFAANTAHLATWNKPTKVARGDKIRVNLSSITAATATGFRMLVTQSAD